MSKIGNLVASDEKIFNLPNTPQFVLIDKVDVDLVITKMSAQIAGNQSQSIVGQAAIQAVSKYLMESLLGADVKAGQIIKVADGWLDKACTLRFTNGAATTPQVNAFSVARGGSPIVSGQETIQQDSSWVFDNFTALFFSATNLDRVSIQGADGQPENLNADEIAAMFAMGHQTDADGKLAGLLCIDNKEGDFGSVEIFATGGSLTVTFLNV